MDNLIFSLNATVPIFLLMVLGFILNKLGLIDDVFASKMNKFVFLVPLPVHRSRFRYRIHPGHSGTVPPLSRLFPHRSGTGRVRRVPIDRLDCPQRPSPGHVKRGHPQELCRAALPLCGDHAGRAGAAALSKVESGGSMLSRQPLPFPQSAQLLQRQSHRRTPGFQRDAACRENPGIYRVRPGSEQPGAYPKKRQLW